jgi:hypothetical protein
LGMASFAASVIRIYRMSTDKLSGYYFNNRQCLG